MIESLPRRGFLAQCLALAAAPAIVQASSLMKLWVPATPELIIPLPPGSYVLQAFQQDLLDALGRGDRMTICVPRCHGKAEYYRIAREFRRMYGLKP